MSWQTKTDHILGYCDIRKALSLILALSIIFNNSYSYASQGRALFSEKPHSQRFVKSATQENIFNAKANPSVITIPDSYGQIVESYNGKGDRLIVHIQDRHVDDACQLNIAKMLRALAENYGIRLVCVEAASRKLDTSFYDSFEDSPLKEKVSRLFVKKGIFNATEYFKITNRGLMVSAFGAEDENLYLEHINTYTSAEPNKDNVLLLISKLIKAADDIKGRIWPPLLKELDKKSAQYADRQIALAEYALYLRESAQRADIDTSPYINFSNFIELLDKEEAIDFNKAEAQRQQLIEDLSHRLPEEELNNLYKYSLDFRLNKISNAAFYAYLEGLFKQAEYVPAPEAYKNLLLYIDYLKMSEAVDHLRLFDELEVVKKGLALNYCNTDKQRQLYYTSARLYDLRDLYSLKLTSEKLSGVQNNPSDYDIARISAFIKDAADNLGIQVNFDKDTVYLKSRDLKDAAEFYRAALARDIAMVENTIKRLPYSADRTAVLITGGFHTAGITNLLKKKDISYIVICPSVGSGDYEKLYADRMRGLLPDYPELFEALQQMLAVPAVTGDARRNQVVQKIFGNTLAGAEVLEALQEAGIDARDIASRQQEIRDSLSRNQDGLTLGQVIEIISGKSSSGGVEPKLAQRLERTAARRESVISTAVLMAALTYPDLNPPAMPIVPTTDAGLISGRPSFEPEKMTQITAALPGTMPAIAVVAEKSSSAGKTKKFSFTKMARIPAIVLALLGPLYLYFRAEQTKPLVQAPVTAAASNKPDAQRVAPPVSRVVPKEQTAVSEPAMNIPVPRVPPAIPKPAAQAAASASEITLPHPALMIGEKLLFNSKYTIEQNNGRIDSYRKEFARAERIVNILFADIKMSEEQKRRWRWLIRGTGATETSYLPQYSGRSKNGNGIYQVIGPTAFGILSNYVSYQVKETDEIKERKELTAVFEKATNGRIKWGYLKKLRDEGLKNKQSKARVINKLRDLLAQDPDFCMAMCGLVYREVFERTGKMELPDTLKGWAERWKEYYNTKFGSGTVKISLERMKAIYTEDISEALSMQYKEARRCYIEEYAKRAQGKIVADAEEEAKRSFLEFAKTSGFIEQQSKLATELLWEMYGISSVNILSRVNKPVKAEGLSLQYVTLKGHPKVHFVMVVTASRIRTTLVVCEDISKYLKGKEEARLEIDIVGSYNEKLGTLIKGVPAKATTGPQSVSGISIEALISEVSSTATPWLEAIKPVTKAASAGQSDIVSLFDKRESAAVQHIREITAPSANMISKGQCYPIIIERGLLSNEVISLEIAKIFEENSQVQEGKPSLLLVLDVTKKELSALRAALNIPVSENIICTEGLLESYPEDRLRRLESIAEKLRQSPYKSGKNQIGIAANPVESDKDVQEFESIFEVLNKSFGIKVRTQRLNEQGIASLHSIVQELVSSLIDPQHSRYAMALYILDMLKPIEPFAMEKIEQYRKDMQQIIRSA